MKSTMISIKHLPGTIDADGLFSKLLELSGVSLLKNKRLQPQHADIPFDLWHMTHLEDLGWPFMDPIIRNTCVVVMASNLQLCRSLLFISVKNRQIWSLGTFVRLDNSVCCMCLFRVLQMSSVSLQTALCWLLDLMITLFTSTPSQREDASTAVTGSAQ